MASLAQVRHDIANTEKAIERCKSTPAAEMTLSPGRIRAPIDRESQLASLREQERILCQNDTTQTPKQKLE